METKYISQLNEATRTAEDRLEKQEKLIKTQMNDLFLKLQNDFAEQSKNAAQLMQDKEDEWRVSFSVCLLTPDMIHSFRLGRLT